MRINWLLAAISALLSSAIVALATNIIATPLPYVFVNGAVADANQVNSDFNTIVNAVNSGAASAGANSDITSLNALSSLTAGTGNFTTLNGTTSTIGTLNVGTLNGTSTATLQSGLNVSGGNVTTVGSTNLANFGGLPVLLVNASTGLVSTYTASGGAPYTGSGAIVVPIGQGVRATNTASVRGTVSGGGAFSSTFNVNTGSGGWDGSGNLTVNFANNLNSAAYQIITSNCESGGGKILHALASSKGASGFIIQYVDDSIVGTPCSTPVDFVVMGGY